jgi:coenzyme PQQ precursor peptide PqqA
MFETGRDSSILCCSQLSGKRGQATAFNRAGFSDTFGNVIMPSIRETANGWKPPRNVEVPVGMEINLYACAAGDLINLFAKDECANYHPGICCRALRVNRSGSFVQGPADVFVFPGLSVCTGARQ